MTLMRSIPEDVFKAYSRLGTPSSVDVIDMGLINKTYVVTTNKIKYILQEVSSIFDKAVNEDSDAVSTYLARQDIIVPSILRTDFNALFISLNSRIFRVLKYIDGKTFHTMQSLAMAESSGKIVGRFHRALLDFSYEYRSLRRHSGDYGYHKENLLSAMIKHSDHDFHERVVSLAKDMMRDFDSVINGLSYSLRHVHGDPKLSNIIFNDNKEAICLVDFDTLRRTGWALEMGDALRSWCNPHKEDAIESFVDLAVADYALKGYGSLMRGFFDKEEASALVGHAQAITLCLALRYLADVLNENFFAYDRARFERAAEHNILRALAMYQLFKDFLHKKKDLWQLVSHHLL